jgi:hypothetical protein
MKKLLGIAIIFLLPVVSYGQLVTIQIEATVNYLDDYYNLLQGKVALGNTITGTYTYDTSTQDTDSTPYIGAYFHYSLPSGLSLTVNDLTFKSNPTNTKLLIALINDGFNPVGDFYRVRSYNNLLTNSNVQVDSITWQLDDLSGTALSNTNLLPIAPILPDWDYSTLYISGGNGIPCDKTFSIHANVISAVLVPEPISILFFSFGLLALRKQK